MTANQYVPTLPEMLLIKKALDEFIVQQNMIVRTPADEKLYPAITSERNAARILRDVIEVYINDGTNDNAPSDDDLQHVNGIDTARLAGNDNEGGGE